MPGKQQVVVDADIKDFVLAGDEVHAPETPLVGAEQVLRQPGGERQVVSGDAVSDVDGEQTFRHSRLTSNGKGAGGQPAPCIVLSVGC